MDRIIDRHNVKDPHALYEALKHRGPSPSLSARLQPVESRAPGISRISVLRTAISLTYVPESLPDLFALTFLPVAYACSQKVPQLEGVPVGLEDLNILNLSIERKQEVARKPHWAAVGNHDDPNYSSILYREEFAGPIAFLRLLLLLSERGLLSKIPSWSAIPSYNGDAVEPGMKKPSLSRLKQITSLAVIRKFVHMSVKRVKELREVHGRKEVQEGKLGDALWSYACGSELSASIIAFLESPETATELKARFLDDVKKELVLCLGNAAEMSIRGRQHLEGLKFASAAVSIGTECAGITETIRTKNNNRYATALNAVH